MANQYTVLVVDDDDTIRDIVHMILEENGHTVLDAINGKEALAIAGVTPPDLLITDIVMPDMEGIELIRLFKKRFPACGIIAISGAGSAETYLLMAEGFGAHRGIHKPFTQKQVEAAVRETMEIMRPIASLPVKTSIAP